MSREATSRAHCPEDVLRLLPWYDDEALGDDERARIEAHAAACSDCRREIEWMTVDDDEAAVALPSAAADSAYARVRARIEQSGAREAAQRRVAAQRSHSTRASAWRRVGLAAAVAVAALGAFAVGERYVALRASVYETATGPDVAAAAAGPELDVILERSATAAQIGDALRAVGATIVDGPSRLGVYRVRLQPGADATAAAKLLRAGTRSDGEEAGVASLAEPVAP